MRGISGMLGIAVAALMLVFSVDTAEAQVSTGDAAHFVGKWTLTLQPPAGLGGGGGGARAGGGGAGGGRMGGGGPMVLEIVDDGGQLKASMAGGMAGGQATPITSVSRSGESLVLGYTMAAAGQSLPATIRLTPTAEGANADLDLGGMFTLSGTATKE